MAGSRLAFAERAEARIHAYLQRRHGPRPDVLRKRQARFAGDAKGATTRLKPYADAGAAHMCPRLAGDSEPWMEAVARIRQEPG
jgi:hypothetical protein